MVQTAYDNDAGVKARYVAQMRAHAAADEIVKGQYWQDGKGCFVGCTIHGSDHAAFDSILGPGGQMIAQLADAIFEGCTNLRSKKFAVEFHEAIRPGADLSRVGWQFLHWELTTPDVNPGITDPLVSSAVAQCAAIVQALGRGDAVDYSAAWSAESAAWSAWSAWSAAESARNAARSGAQSAAYDKMADKLIELLAAA